MLEVAAWAMMKFGSLERIYTVRRNVLIFIYRIQKIY